MLIQHTTIVRTFICVSLFLAVFALYASAAPGDLDLSFGTGGKVVSPIGKISGDHSNASALQADGKIVLAGDSLSDNPNFSNEAPNLAVVRINPNGSLDASFGSGGKVIKRFPSLTRAFSVLIQPDGKILVGGITFGQVSTGTGYRYFFLLARLNSDGSFDNSFGTNGIVETRFAGSSSNYLYSLALQNDGKIVATGLAENSIGVARYNTDGSLDTSFNGSGELLVAINASSRAYAVAIQPDGKIVLGGYAAGNFPNFALARLNSDGSLDNTFDGDGKLTTAIGTSSSLIKAIKIQPDGKIVAAGYGGPYPTRNLIVARYNPNGSLDTSFDADGIAVIADGNDYLATGLNLQTDGKIVVGGYVGVVNSATYYDFLSVRYNPDGSFDASYNGSGKVITPISITADIATSLLIQPDGKIVISGYGDRGTDADILLVRNNADGSLDASFDGDGIATVELGNSADIINKIAIQPDGKIIAAGYAFSGFFQSVAVARYNADGSLDASFGTAGIATAQIGTNGDYTTSLLIQPDGKIVAAGTSSGNGDGTDGASLVRLNSDGSLDMSFGAGGKVLTNTLNHSGAIYAAALQSDGKIVVAGLGSFQGSSDVFFLNRYNADGSLDTSFGSGGTVYTVFNTQGFANANAVAIQSDGKIVAAGYTDGSYAFARYNTDGSLDTSFDGDGKVIISQANAYNSINDLVIQQNGKIVAAGNYQNATDYDAAVLRLNTDGSLDASFGSGGKVVTAIGIGDNGFGGVLLQSDGKIVAGGYSNNGLNNDFTVVRYLGDTTIVSNRTLFDFDGDGKADVSVFRPSNGAWYLLQSTAGFVGVTFGASTDKIVPADYDGDGKTDVAVYRDGTWYLQRSALGFTGVAFGSAEDIPVPADYDGDGKADIAVFRPSNGVWYLLRSSLGFTGFAFGQNGDKPVAADYDGDGKADIAVYRSGIWYLQRSTLGFTGVAFGDVNDKPVPADYDGDGKADVAVFRPSNGTWYLQRSGLGFTGVAFGDAADLPVAADYDGDGKADIAVYRPSSGTWYLLRSQTGFTGVTFGANGDKPIPNAFVR